MRKRKMLSLVAVLAISAVVLAACNDKSKAPKYNFQGIQQNQSEQLAKKYAASYKLPIDKINGSAEQANLGERLVRLSDPNKIGYFYGMSNTGQVVSYYVTKGKVSSTGSQLTTPDEVTRQCPHSTGGGYDCAVTTTHSIGDDGTYGPEECESNGVFFFTTENVLVTWCGPFQWSDAPLHLNSAPLITLDANSKPSSSGGQR